MKNCYMIDEKNNKFSNQNKKDEKSGLIYFYKQINSRVILYVF